MESKSMNNIPMSNLKRYKSKFKTKIDYNPIEFDFELKTFKLIIINSLGKLIKIRKSY
jgi:hypothetical protein